MRCLLVTPWRWDDEDRASLDMRQEWRNGPFNVLLLGTWLRHHGHQVELADLQRELVAARGNLDTCLWRLEEQIREFKPEIIGVSFFSVHFVEVQRTVRTIRGACRRHGLAPLLVAGGIHATVEPQNTIEQLGFDYCCVGEGERPLRRLADGDSPDTIPGIVGPGQTEMAPAEVVQDLDELPFPDWSLCDYRFYAHPSWARLKVRQTSSLDVMLGRGCAFRCNFCAYGCLSNMRFHSADYLVDEVDALQRRYGIPSYYFLDSTIGNNRPLLTEFCERLITRGLSKRISWLANMRADQVDRGLLTLLQRAGCAYLFYGFESGSQRMLDAMHKGTTVEQNRATARLHEELRFPYNASIVLNYPGERESDVQESIAFLRDVLPPSIGISPYVPLPGSPDYERLKADGRVDLTDPLEWRRLGQCEVSNVYADIPECRLRDLLAEVKDVAYNEIPKKIQAQWQVVDARAGPCPRPGCDESSQGKNSVWPEPFTVLRNSLAPVTLGASGDTAVRLCQLGDDELADLWLTARERAVTGAGFNVRGWYHLLYKDIFRGKRVMDLGSGFGLDGITFAQHGAEMTFVDIVPGNLTALERICGKLGITNAQFHYLENMRSFESLPENYDVIWCQGSLINAPFEVIRTEVQELLKHLPVGGRWVELAYPRARWERDGCLPFEQWGDKTDGGAPWVEWYDLAKLSAAFHPARFNTVLYFEFYNSDFNWFDLVRRA